MTQGDDVAQCPGPTEPKDGRSATPPWPTGQGLAPFRNPSSTCVNLSRQEGYPMWEMWCYHKAWPPDQVKWPASLTCGPPDPKLWPRHRLNPPINTLLLLPVESVKIVRFSPYSAPKFILVELRERWGSKGWLNSRLVGSPQSSLSVKALPESVRVRQSFLSSSLVECGSSAGIMRILIES
jgi:hypothetical protein